MSLYIYNMYNIIRNKTEDDETNWKIYKRRVSKGRLLSLAFSV